MQRAIAYVDGFNVYHGVHELTGRKHLWLDVQSLCQRVAPDGHELVAVKYFTARVRGTTPSYHRQNKYLRALATHCPAVEITEGRFQKQTRQCRSCAAKWITYEEKESDVSPAVRTAKRLRPRAQIVAVFPPLRSSDPLRKVVDRTLHIDQRMLRGSQLPDEIVTTNGIKLSRPAYWS